MAMIPHQNLVSLVDHLKKSLLNHRHQHQHLHPLQPRPHQHRHRLPRIHRTTAPRNPANATCPCATILSTPASAQPTTVPATANATRNTAPRAKMGRGPGRTVSRANASPASCVTPIPTSRRSTGVAPRARRRTSACLSSSLRASRCFSSLRSRTASACSSRLVRNHCLRFLGREWLALDRSDAGKDPIFLFHPFLGSWALLDCILIILHLFSVVLLVLI